MPTGAGLTLAASVNVTPGPASGRSGALPAGSARAIIPAAGVLRPAIDGRSRGPALGQSRRKVSRTALEGHGEANLDGWLAFKVTACRLGTRLLGLADAEPFPASRTRQEPGKGHSLGNVQFRLALGVAYFLVA